MSLILTDRAIMLRQLAASLMPLGHPVRQFEHELIHSLRGAERRWFHDHDDYEEDAGESRRPPEHVLSVLVGAALMVTFGLALNIITGEGLSDYIVQATGI